MNNHYTGINTPDELLQAYTAMFMFLGGSVSLSPEESDLPNLCDSGMLRNLPVESNNIKYHGGKPPSQVAVPVQTTMSPHSRR